MSSIELQRQRVEQEMTKMVDELDKSFLRKMQVQFEVMPYLKDPCWNNIFKSFITWDIWFYSKGDMHRCAARCCDDQTSGIDSVQGCVERCSNPVNRAQQFVHTELEGFQGRLQRCVMVINLNFLCLVQNNNILNRVRSTAMQRWHQSVDASVAHRIGHRQVYQPVWAVRNQVRGQARRPGTESVQNDPTGTQQGTAKSSRCVVNFY